MGNGVQDARRQSKSDLNREKRGGGITEYNDGSGGNDILVWCLISFTVLRSNPCSV